MRIRLVITLLTLLGMAAAAVALLGIAGVFAVDEPLVVPDTAATAVSARVDEACLTASVPLVDQSGAFVRTKVFTVCATSPGLTGAQKLKLRDALVVMAKNKGLIP